MTKGRDPSLEIEIMIREEEKTHKEEAIQIQEIDPDFPGIIGHNLGIDSIQETTEEGVLLRIKIEEIIEMIGISPGREAKRFSRGALPADVRSA